MRLPPEQTDAARDSVRDDIWHRLLEVVGRSSPLLRRRLAVAHPVSFNGKLLTIGFDTEAYREFEVLDSSNPFEWLQYALREIGHAGCSVKFIQSESPSAPQVLPPAPSGPPCPHCKGTGVDRSPVATPLSDAYEAEFRLDDERGGNIEEVIDAIEFARTLEVKLLDLIAELSVLRGTTK